jgi:hypothetical protein
MGRSKRRRVSHKASASQALADLPELEAVGGEVIESGLVLVLDALLDDTDFGFLRGVDLKHPIRFIPDHPAVQGVFVV